MPLETWYRVAGMTAWTALAVTAATGPVHAQRTIQIAVPVGEELTAEVWHSAPAADGFLQRTPAEGAPPTEHTEFRVAYDRSTIYVRVRADDTEADKIIGYLTRRDGESPSDWVRVLIDFYPDHRTAYEFAVNPAGVKLDRYWFNDTSSDTGWDAVWDAGVTLDDRGWTAEFRIPFSQLRFHLAKRRCSGWRWCETSRG